LGTEGFETASSFHFPFSDFQVARAALDMLPLTLMSARRHSHASA
jgi:hypothetical protein